MVFAANGATVVGGTRARRPVPARRAGRRKARAYLDWFRRDGYTRCTTTAACNEGEGDIVLRRPGDPGRVRLPHRRRPPSAELERAVRPARASACGWSTRASTTWTPRCACSTPTPSPTTRPAFDDAGRAALAAHFAELIEANGRGRRGARPERGQRRPARRPARAGRRGWPGSWPRAGSSRSPVDMSELRKAGGGPKCCTLELQAVTRAEHRQCTAISADELRAQSEAHSAHNYHPLPVVIAEAEGAWVTDVDGRRYLDMLAAYSALNFGHRHPRLVAAAQRQLDRVTLVSRAFEHDQFGPFCAELADAGRHGDGAADEHRRRGGRDRDQDRAQVGLRGQGRAGRPGRDRRLRRQLPRPHHHDRQLLHRPGRARRRSARTRPASGSCPTATWTRWPRPSTSTWSPCWSSRSRARPACWCRRPASWPGSGSCAPRTAR